MCGVASVFSAASLLAAPLSIVTKPLGCVAKDRNARITSRIEGRVKTARVFFHSVDPKCDEYFVEMRQSPNDPTLYWAVLPLVAPTTLTLSYQVRVDPGNGEKAVLSPSEPLTVPVREACTAEPLSEAEQRMAENLTLGLSSSGQTGAPCAFRCNGVTSILTTANELRPNEECFRVLAANKPWYRTTAGRVGIGGAALLGGYIWNSNRETAKAVSPARP
jgi:hypothetical protein